MRDLVFNGSYPAYARDTKPGPNDKPQYDDSYINKTVTATVNLRLHCLDGTYPYMDLAFPQEVHIYERNNVYEIHAPDSVKGGQPLALEIIVTDNAPPSNSRIYLDWSGDGVDLLASPPPYIDLSAGTKSGQLSVPTLANNDGKKNVTVRARAKTEKTATISITR